MLSQKTSKACPELQTLVGRAGTHVAFYYAEILEIVQSKPSGIIREGQKTPYGGHFEVLLWSY